MKKNAHVVSKRTIKLQCIVWLLPVVLMFPLSAPIQAASEDALIVDETGKVGIGTTEPGTRLDVAGTVRSKDGGFQFPDNTLQTTAVVMPAGAVIAFNLPACPAGWSEYKPAYGRFIRGIDKSGKKIDPDGQRKEESYQEDAIRNITGILNGVSGMANRAWYWGFLPGENGAFTVKKNQDTYNRYAGDYNPSGGVGTSAGFDASKTVPTAEDNRPKNVALLYCQKL